jgi:hypothetical protein
VIIKYYLKKELRFSIPWMAEALTTCLDSGSRCATLCSSGMTLFRDYVTASEPMD